MEFEETKIGRLEHKIEKLQIVKLVPGVEWIKPYGLSGDHGITLEEYTPFGVVGAILPVTHSVPTLSGNIINIVAAGNAVVFNPHPGGARSAALAVRTLREQRPSLVVSTGAGVAVPFFVAARAMGIPTVFIEVYDRVDSPTLTGRLCGPFTTRRIVQWDQQLDFYPDAHLVGPLL